MENSYLRVTLKDSNEFGFADPESFGSTLSLPEDSFTEETVRGSGMLGELSSVTLLSSDLLDQYLAQNPNEWPALVTPTSPEAAKYIWGLIPVLTWDVPSKDSRLERMEKLIDFYDAHGFSISREELPHQLPEHQALSTPIDDLMRWSKDYDEKREAWLATLPDDLRAEYDELYHNAFAELHNLRSRIEKGEMLRDQDLFDIGDFNGEEEYEIINERKKAYFLKFLAEETSLTDAWNAMVRADAVFLRENTFSLPFLFLDGVDITENAQKLARGFSVDTPMEEVARQLTDELNQLQEERDARERQDQESKQKLFNLMKEMGLEPKDDKQSNN
jgi:hypothetical protein